MVRDGLLGVLQVPVGGGAGTTLSMDLANNVLTIKQSSSLLEAEALGFDDEEDQPEGGSAAVGDLC